MLLPYDEFKRVGLRVQVGAFSRQVGSGTYLWDDEILLDTGKKILASKCEVRVVAPSKVPPFEVTLRSDSRVFEDKGYSLINTREWLQRGTEVRIEQIAVKPWNHGGYVAGRFGSKYWLIMSELELPHETPHLQAVK